MGSISLNGINKSFGSTEVLKNINLDIKDGESNKNTKACKVLSLDHTHIVRFFLRLIVCHFNSH